MSAPFDLSTVRKATIFPDGHIVTIHGSLSTRSDGFGRDRVWCEVTERGVGRGPERPVELSFGAVGLLPAILGAPSVWVEPGRNGELLLRWLTRDGNQLGTAAEGAGVSGAGSPARSFSEDSSAKSILGAKVLAVHRNGAAGAAAKPRGRKP